MSQEHIARTLADISLNASQELDALVVGAGFGGAYQLKRLRDEGFTVKLVESGDDYGGVWYWNRYPGGRVDIAAPFYQFDDPELWKGFRWKQRFPDSTEIRAYFSHVADKWDLRKDTEFGMFVQSAHWDDKGARWLVSAGNRKTYKVKYLLLNTGFAAKRYIPDWNGISSFKGEFLHPSAWPHEEPNLKGKRVAVIGTGSTGTQLSTEISKVAEEFVLFQRTPNTSLPMGQIDYGDGEHPLPVEELHDLYKGRVNSFSGLDLHFLGRNTFDDDVKTRRQVYEKLWAEGDFSFWLATYRDMLFVKEANIEAYNFWRDKTRARIQDERLRDILAPMKQPYGFGCKRISLEQGFFEIFNEPHVHLVDVNETPIQEVTENGIKTSEKEWLFDFIICATGYDAVTGGLTQIDIRGSSGESLKNHWKEGVYSYLGMAVSGFPNMFYTYGPQAPTALCNGPTCAQLQGDWIVDAVRFMRANGLTVMAPKREAEKQWRKDIERFANMTLLPTTDSWYMGTNIPGKPREPLIFLGGVPKYYEALAAEAGMGYKNFDMS